VREERHDRVFRAGRLFLDLDMTPGSFYPNTIGTAVEKSRVALAVVGPHWYELTDSTGRPRIDDPADWVRQELRIAFQNKIPVVSVLPNRARLPTTDLLPAGTWPIRLSQRVYVSRRTPRLNLTVLANHIERMLPDPARCPSGRSRSAGRENGQDSDARTGRPATRARAAR
jgi:hypothetical protein